MLRSFFFFFLAADLPSSFVGPLRWLFLATRELCPAVGADQGYQEVAEHQEALVALSSTHINNTCCASSYCKVYLYVHVAYNHWVQALFKGFHSTGNSGGHPHFLHSPRT